MATAAFCIAHIPPPGGIVLYNSYDDGDETNGSDADGKTTDEEEDNLVDNEGVIDGTVG